MKLIAQEPFSWAHRGVEVEHFEAGQEIETEDQDLIDVSKREGWTAEPDAQASAADARGAAGVGPAVEIQPTPAPAPASKKPRKQ